MKTVVVGLSGGVDSSVAALLLKEQGYRVIGLFMKNWEEEEGPCPAEADSQDAQAVAHQLGIPCYTVNFAKAYWERVFARCLEAYRAGYTPNPDIWCNKEIKFDLLLKKAKLLGADYLATGHYCRRVRSGERWLLARGRDGAKDQSYFLYTLQDTLLGNLLFPVGDYDKKQVRALAAAAGLVTAHKKDSTGICFIGKRDFKTFISRFIPLHPGCIERLNGACVGEHDGCAYYTIGQRHGLHIGGAGEAWYVVGKDVARNVLFVEQGDDHPSLYREELTMQEVSWVTEPPPFPFRCTAKIRYRSPDVSCTLVSPSHVRFDKGEKAVTPQQSIVFYQGEICLGGGLIC